MLVLLGVVFINLMGFGILMPILPFYAQSFHAPAWQVTWAFAAFSIGNFFAEPVWGRLSDRIGRRPILIGTIAASGLGFIALAFAPNIWAVLAIRLFSGLTTGNLSTIQSYIADITPPRFRSGPHRHAGRGLCPGLRRRAGHGRAAGQAATRQRGLPPAPVPGRGGMSLIAALGVILFVRESRGGGQKVAAIQGPHPGEVWIEARRHPVLGRALIVTSAPDRRLLGGRIHLRPVDPAPLWLGAVQAVAVLRQRGRYRCDRARIRHRPPDPPLRRGGDATATGLAIIGLSLAILPLGDSRASSAPSS